MRGQTYQEAVVIPVTGVNPTSKVQTCGPPKVLRPVLRHGVNVWLLCELLLPIRYMNRVEILRFFGIDGLDELSVGGGQSGSYDIESVRGGSNILLQYRPFNTRRFIGRKWPGRRIYMAGENIACLV